MLFILEEYITVYILGNFISNIVKNLLVLEVVNNRDR